MYIQYKYDDICQAVDIEDIVEDFLHVSIPKNRKIQCISGEHSDKNPSMQVTSRDKGNYCYCFSCGRSFNPIQVVSKATGVSPKDASRLIIERYGLPLEAYSNISELNLNVNIPRKDQFPLTLDELNLIGLPYAMHRTITFDDYNGYDILAEKETTKKTTKQIPNLLDEWNESEENRLMVFSMIVGKTIEAREILKKEILRKGEYTINFACEWGKEINHGLEIFKKLGEDFISTNSINESIKPYKTYTEENVKAWQDMDIAKDYYASIKDFNDKIDALHKLEQTIIPKIEISLRYNREILQNYGYEEFKIETLIKKIEDLSETAQKETTRQISSDVIDTLQDIKNDKKRKKIAWKGLD